jgi:hypothetical protein
MASITKQHVGMYTYLYESVSYRDELGRPRNTKTKIGKIDPFTGETIYTPEYVARTPNLQKEVSKAANESKIPQEVGEEILDNVKSYGVYWFIRSAAEKLGLLDILKQAIPSLWKEILTIASYLIASDKPVMYCQDWLSENEWFNVGSMTSQRISELLTAIGEQERNDFYRAWCRHIQEREYVALDITSFSSYSKQIQECEFGHNRDNENLRQTNLCMLFGEQSKLPIYQTNYSGSLSDVTTLENTIAEFTALLGDIIAVIVMDKGFFSTKNINMLLSKNINFLISIPFTNKFAKKLVEDAREGIDHVDNLIKTSGAPVRGVHKLYDWGTKGKKDKKGIKLHTHIFYDPERGVIERNELLQNVIDLKEMVLKGKDSKKHAKNIKRYLIVKKSSKAPCGCTVKIREDVIEKSLKTTGWFVLLSNYVEDPQEAFDVYRMKDAVEKGFWKYKNNLNLDRLRIHSHERLKNKTFVAFIALILASYVHQIMKEKNLYKHMTFDKVFITLAKLKVSTMSGQHFLRPITREQKDLLKNFDLPQPKYPM